MQKGYQREISSHHFCSETIMVSDTVWIITFLLNQFFMNNSIDNYVMGNNFYSMYTYRSFFKKLLLSQDT